MEMAMEQGAGNEAAPQDLRLTVERLSAATALLERAVEALRASRATTVEASARIQEPSGRRTLPSGMLHLLAKQGVTAESIEAGAQDSSLHGGLDRALCSLSIEQRIAVKSELLRAGLIG